MNHNADTCVAYLRQVPMPPFPNLYRAFLHHFLSLGLTEEDLVQELWVTAQEAQRGFSRVKGGNRFCAYFSTIVRRNLNHSLITHGYLVKQTPQRLPVQNAPRSALSEVVATQIEQDSLLTNPFFLSRRGYRLRNRIEEGSYSANQVAEDLGVTARHVRSTYHPDNLRELLTATPVADFWDDSDQDLVDRGEFTQVSHAINPRLLTLLPGVTPDTSKVESLIPSLLFYGQLSPVLIQPRTGYVIHGVNRLHALRSTECPIIFVTSSAMLANLPVQSLLELRDQLTGQRDPTGHDVHTLIAPLRNLARSGFIHPQKATCLKILSDDLQIWLMKQCTLYCAPGFLFLVLPVHEVQRLVRLTQLSFPDGSVDRAPSTRLQNTILRAKKNFPEQIAEISSGMEPPPPTPAAPHRTLHSLFDGLEED